jgi:hypothetical protein
MADETAERPDLAFVLFTEAGMAALHSLPTLEHKLAMRALVEGNHGAWIAFREVCLALGNAVEGMTRLMAERAQQSNGSNPAVEPTDEGLMRTLKKDTIKDTIKDKDTPHQE